MNATVRRLDTYFDRLVPRSGRADTKAGEIVRALCRIGYRFYNDGDRIGMEYGKETCNPPARFLLEKVPDGQGALIRDIWENYRYDDREYEKKLMELIAGVLDWLDTTDLGSQANTEDMYDWGMPDDTYY